MGRQNLFFITLFALVCSASTATAQDASKKSNESDKLDIKGLEAKYWAPKDTDLAVVQNRTYAKAKRPFLSLSYGPMMNDPYSYGRMVGVAAGYYFSERFGLEAAYEKGNLADNDSVTYFQPQGFTPDYNKFVSNQSLNFIFVPFYAKMSFMDRSILYFDMQFAAGVGQMSYESVIVPESGAQDLRENVAEKATSYNLDFTQQLFFSRHWAIRLDVKNKWSTQNLRKARLNSQPATTRDLGTRNQQDTTILLGFTFFL